MSTPTSTPRPPNHKLPYPSALTPSASASSPAAPALNVGNIRSVPSPANMRSVPSPAYLSSLSSKTIRSPQTTRSPQMTRSPHTNSTPRGANAKSPLHGLPTTGAVGTPRVTTTVNSPAAAMLGMGTFITGTGLTPAAMTTDVGGSVDGVGAGLSVRDQEDERRRRTEEIVKIIGARWGRVSQEGVERCARRVGLECLWEEGQGHNRTLSIAGQGVLIDVEFTGEEVGTVILSFPASGEGVGKGGVQGAEVLRRDLKGQGEGYIMLDAFVGNLERLAVMDRLSEGGVSCFDTVEGIHECLQRIYSWELKKREEEAGTSREERDFETEVMCAGSGRPRMHTRGQVGLALQYWADRRLVGRKRKADAMEVDSKADDHDPENQQIYSAVIECESAPPSLYPPIRISSNWVSPAIEKPPSATAPTLFPPFPTSSPIDWQEPPQTLLPSPDPTNPDPDPTNPTNMNPAPLLSSRSPRARFVARLHPAIVVPLQVAIDIHDSVGAPLAQQSLQPTTYESLLFPPTTTNGSQPPPPHPRTVIAEHTITSYNPHHHGTTTPHRHHHHKYTLFTTPPQSFARRIDSIPFSHPRQLLALLPVLRQWALLGSILRRSLTPTPAPPPPPIPIPSPTNPLTVEEELAALLAPTSPSHKSPSSPTSPSSKSPLAIDILLSLSPPVAPRLRVIFALEGKLRSLVFGVAGNGVVVGGGGEGGRERGDRGNGVGDDEKKENEKIGKVLAVGESVGVLVAWMEMEMGIS